MYSVVDVDLGMMPRLRISVPKGFQEKGKIWASHLLSGLAWRAGLMIPSSNVSSASIKGGTSDCLPLGYYL